MSTSDSDIWKPLDFLIGKWSGKGGGEPGIGDYQRSYLFIFNKTFIEIRNKSTYSPTAKFPQGEVHEDLGYISYDRMRKCFVLRQFHVEGFVNQYISDKISPDGRDVEFISEMIENISPGWRAKETYQIISENEFTETFELAPPGKGFDVYSKVTLRRNKS